MPRYAYRCDACKEVFEVTHGMFFIQEVCKLCHRKGELVKLPCFTIPKTEKLEQKPGKVVDAFIEDAKNDLKKQKKELKSEILK